MGFHWLDLTIILLLVLLWVVPALIVLRDSARRPAAGRTLGRRCALFGIFGALFYFGLLRIHRRLQEAKHRQQLH